MKDERGLYYYPDPADRRERVYVRREGGEIQFRLWRDDRPEIYERHGWLPYGVIEMAANLYQSERNPAANHLRLYDIDVARALILEDGQAGGKV